MSPFLQQHGIVFLSVFAAMTILLATFIANGSQYDDAWLYITALWIIVIPAAELFFKKKK